ncbi:hypothetical protein DOTSEDRAFT_164476 [Dothistroma septosporum NZE10]|uniref:Large ribosomal subunit protein bL21m n=1 Tax=Dothistroma septosporum (strain NZE10 / CBS 128990) TaxID=675120 RepID=N1Q4W7_DOTSN|nr:hypothetical protein DOTSEDRAFT_164476 [Dothistroma septosporum NZE10]
MAAVLATPLKRAVLEPSSKLPPTFLLPWIARLSLSTVATSTETVPPSKRMVVSRRSSPQKAQKTPFQSRSISLASSETHDDATTPLLPPSSSQTPTSASSPLHLSPQLRELLPVLRAQSPHYVTVHVHGNPYLVTEGDTVRLPFLMHDVEPGDVLRLNRAINLGSREFTLKAPAAAPKLKSPTTSTGKFSYIDDRLFVCRAVVIGVESEPLRIKEKTKRRNRHVRKVKSKHRYTILKIKQLRIKSVEELENEDTES